MPQMNIGGKFSFGKSLISENRRLLEESMKHEFEIYVF